MDSKFMKNLASKKTIGAKIEYLLEFGKGKPVSQAELSREVSVSSVWMNNIVRGKKIPSDTLLQRIANFFGLKAVDLFDEKRKELLGIN